MLSVTIPGGGSAAEDFRCMTCGTEFEIIGLMTGGVDIKCPHCGAAFTLDGDSREIAGSDVWAWFLVPKVDSGV